MKARYLLGEDLEIIGEDVEINVFKKLKNYICHMLWFRYSENYIFSSSELIT